MIDNIAVSPRAALHLAAEAQFPELSMHELASVVQNMEDFFSECSNSLAEQYVWNSADLKALAWLAYRGE